MPPKAKNIHIYCEAITPSLLTILGITLRGGLINSHFFLPLTDFYTISTIIKFEAERFCPPSIFA